MSIHTEMIYRLRSRAEDRRRVGWELSDAMLPGEMEAAAQMIDDLSLALHQIAGHGNITGDRAREIAAAALGETKPIA